MTEELASRETNRFLLRGAHVVTPDGVLEDGEVVFEAGRIARVGSAGRSHVGGASVLSLEGLTLYPGFIDIHIHGALGVDVNEATAGGLQKVSEYLASQGVTGWLPTLVPGSEAEYRRAAESVLQLMRAQGAGEVPPAARALGLHYEGPFVNDAQCGALRTRFFRIYRGENDLAGIVTVERKGAAHFMTLAPEVAGGVELIEELTRRGWVASIGHTRADQETLERAFAAGARHMTHFMNAMPQLHHREPGPVGWGLAREGVTLDMIADLVHLHPLALKLVVRCKSSENVTLISDAVSPAGLGDGEFDVWGEKIAVESGRTANARGHIAGSVSSLGECVRNMLALGATPVEVARMASLNPARLLSLDGECGSIEEGKRANLTALDGEGRVRLTIVGGRVAYEM